MIFFKRKANEIFFNQLFPKFPFSFFFSFFFLKICIFAKWFSKQTLNSMEILDPLKKKINGYFFSLNKTLFKKIKTCFHKETAYFKFCVDTRFCIHNLIKEDD